MTIEEKIFIYNLLNKNYLLDACDYNYANDDEKEFKADHHITFKQAEQIVKKYISELSKI